MKDRESQIPPSPTLREDARRAKEDRNTARRNALRANLRRRKTGTEDVKSDQDTSHE